MPHENHKKKFRKRNLPELPKNLLVLVTHRLKLLLTLMLGDLLATLFLEVAHFELSLFYLFIKRKISLITWQCCSSVC